MNEPDQKEDRLNSNKITLDKTVSDTTHAIPIRESTRPRLFLVSSYIMAPSFFYSLPPSLDSQAFCGKGDFVNEVTEAL